MEDLLRDDFTTHYDLPVCTEANLAIRTVEPYFEIEDTDTREIVLHTVVGRGMARFSNPNSLTIVIVNYDKFITVLPHRFENGRKRCDIVLVSNSHFILGELKNRNISNLQKSRKVRSGAKKQLFVSLTTLLAVPQIGALANNKTVKKCCYFNKQTDSPALITATTAFNRLSTIFQDGFQMSYLGIEGHGFEFWEYSGAQTLRLT